MSETENLMRGLYEHLVKTARNQGFEEDLARFQTPLEVRSKFDIRSHDVVVDIQEAVIVASQRKLFAVGFGNENFRDSTPGRVVVFGGEARPVTRSRLIEIDGQKSLKRVVDESSEEILKSLLRENARFTPAPAWGKFYTYSEDAEDLHVDCWANDFPFGGPEIGRGFERWNILRLATRGGLTACEGVLIKIIKDAKW